MFVWNNSLAALAAARSVDPVRWQRGFSAVVDRIAPRFARYEPLRLAAALMLGLLSGLERKNCWTIAEQRGQRSPDGLQHLLARASWDADAVRDDLRGYVVDAFGDDAAVVVVDETGDVKKGEKSVGVQRQYTGIAGRIENAQVAVYLTYAAPRGHAFIDRALYLPKSWVEDQPRRDVAGVPADAAFATKPALATTMITRAVQAGVPAGWVGGDEVYGADPALRRTGREHRLGYVLQVAANRRVDTLPALIPESAWQTYSCGRGSKGHRGYAWALELLPEPGDPDTAGQRHLLIRRNRVTGEPGLPTLLQPRPDHPGHPGEGGRATVADRGILPNRQGPGRAGPAPGGGLDLLAPVDHPGHARPRLPGRGHRPGTRAQPHPAGADLVDCQRVPLPLRRPPPGCQAHHHHPAGLVELGVDDTKPEPAPTTTDDERKHNDHDLRL